MAVETEVRSHCDWSDTFTPCECIPVHFHPDITSLLCRKTCRREFRENSVVRTVCSLQPTLLQKKPQVSWNELRPCHTSQSPQSPEEWCWPFSHHCSCVVRVVLFYWLSAALNVSVKSILRLAFPCNIMWSRLEWWVGVWVTHSCCICEGVPSLWAWTLSAVTCALGCTGEFNREFIQASCPGHPLPVARVGLSRPPVHGWWNMSVSGSKYDWSVNSHVEWTVCRNSQKSLIHLFFKARHLSYSKFCFLKL